MMNRKKIQIITLGLLYVAGVVFFLSTSPNSLPLPLLIVPFLYIFICAYLTFNLIFTKVMPHSRKSNVLAAVIATGLTLLLLLSSLHQLTARDILLALGIAVILVWYMHKK